MPQCTHRLRPPSNSFRSRVARYAAVLWQSVAVFSQFVGGSGAVNQSCLLASFNEIKEEGELDRYEMTSRTSSGGRSVRLYFDMVSSCKANRRAVKSNSRSCTRGESGASSMIAAIGSGAVRATYRRAGQDNFQYDGRKWLPDPHSNVRMGGARATMYKRHRAPASCLFAGVRLTTSSGYTCVQRAVMQDMLAFRRVTCRTSDRRPGIVQVSQSHVRCSHSPTDRRELRL